MDHSVRTVRLPVSRDAAEEWLKQNDPEYDTYEADAEEAAREMAEAARAMGDYNDPIWMSRNNYRPLGNGGYIRNKASSGS